MFTSCSNKSQYSEAAMHDCYSMCLRKMS